MTPGTRSTRHCAAPRMSPPCGTHSPTAQSTLLRPITPRTRPRRKSVNGMPRPTAWSASSPPSRLCTNRWLQQVLWDGQMSHGCCPQPPRASGGSQVTGDRLPPMIHPPSRCTTRVGDPPLIWLDSLARAQTHRTWAVCYPGEWSQHSTMATPRSLTVLFDQPTRSPLLPGWPRSAVDRTPLRTTDEIGLPGRDEEIDRGTPEDNGGKVTGMERWITIASAAALLVLLVWLMVGSWRRRTARDSVLSGYPVPTSVPDVTV